MGRPPLEVPSFVGRGDVAATGLALPPDVVWILRPGELPCRAQIGRHLDLEGILVDGATRVILTADEGWAATYELTRWWQGARSSSSPSTKVGGARPWAPAAGPELAAERRQSDQVSP